MAVDTRQKRFSMMSFSSPIPFFPMWQADGSVDADDRSHQLILYSGVVLQDTTPVVESFFMHKLIGVGK